MTFKTQQEIWQYLAESEDNKVTNVCKNIIGFNSGKLYSYTCDCEEGWYFKSPEDWQPYTEPKKRPMTIKELRDLGAKDVILNSSIYIITEWRLFTNSIVFDGSPFPIGTLIFEGYKWSTGDDNWQSFEIEE